MYKRNAVISCHANNMDDMMLFIKGAKSRTLVRFLDVFFLFDMAVLILESDSDYLKIIIYHKY